MAQEQKLSAGKYHRQIMDRYFDDSKQARDQGRLVAWSSALSPMEILQAFDIVTLYPENHAASCAAWHVAQPILEAAEDKGYSMDICSYARNGIGQALLGPDTPGAIGGLSKPDFLAVVNNSCGTVVKWYEAFARILNIPVFLIDVPYIHDNEQPQEHLRYVVRQLKDLVAFLEERTGRKLDYDRLGNVMRLSKAASGQRQAIVRLCQHKPTPITCFELFTSLAPMLCLRGTDEALTYYSLLREELEAKIARGVTAIPNERFRLYWDNIAIWFRLRDLSQLLAAKDAVLVASAYTSAWTFDDLDPDRPLESIAFEISDCYINRSIAWRAGYISKLIDDYAIDGMVMHSARSCKPFFIGQYDLMNQIAARKGIPSVMIDGDQADERLYSDAQVNSRLEAFLETLAARGGQQ